MSTTDLVTAPMLAREWGVTRQRVHQLSELDDFPEPVPLPGITRYWRRSSVERWLRRTGWLDRRQMVG